MSKVLKINQLQIAKELGISRSYVCQLVSGRKKSDKYSKQIKSIISKAAKRLLAA